MRSYLYDLLAVSAAITGVSSRIVERRDVTDAALYAYGSSSSGINGIPVMSIGGMSQQLMKDEMNMNEDSVI
jgi:hypothetical protein